MLVYEEYFNTVQIAHACLRRIFQYGRVHLRFTYTIVVFATSGQNSSPFKYATQLDVSTNYTVRSNILRRFLQQIEEIKNLTRFDLRWKFCDMLLWIDTFIFHSLPWLTFVSTT